MKRVEQIVSLIAWTILASLLFALFGVYVAHAGVSVLGRLDVLAEGDLQPARAVARCLAGLGLLGVSVLYRKTAHAENAGSLAAWLAGWVLALHGLASSASLLDEQAAPVLLLSVLGVWAAIRLTRYFARYDPGDPDDES